MKKKLSIVSIIFALAIIFAGCSGGGGNFELSQSNVTLKIGDVQKLTATNKAGKFVEDIIWTSDNETIATVSSSGRIEAVSKGSATITATNKKGIKKECAVNVVEIEVKKIELSNKSLKIKVGQSKKLTPNITPKNATDTDLKWISDDESVALVNSSGLVTGKSAGTINITCYSSNGKEASCTVTVSKNKSSSNNNNNNYSKKTTQKVEYTEDSSAFYGIFCAAYKSNEKAIEHAQMLQDKGFENATVYLTTDWTNLNKKPVYAVVSDVYSTKREAEKHLKEVKKVVPNAYVKYSGSWIP